MLLNVERERLLGDILRGSFEAVTLDDLGVNVLPLLQRALNSRTSVLYQCDQQGIIPIAGDLSLCRKYASDYYSLDSLEIAKQRLNLRVFYSCRASALPEFKEYLQESVYNEFLHPFQIDNNICVRLSATGYHEAGMVGLFLARSSREPDYSGVEDVILNRALPALEASVRRSARLQRYLGTQTVMETMLNLNSQGMIALDLNGNLLWASEHAEALVGLVRGGRQILPDSLVQAARRLGALAGKQPPLQCPPSSIVLPRAGKASLLAELRLSRAHDGTRFVIVEIEAPEISPRLAEVAMRHKITRAETDVLALISQGLSDEAISHRLFISKATVHTHVGRILVKLGVRSRVQAALLARGIRPETDRSNETE